MASRQHYIWAAGHFIVLLASVRYLLAWITFKSAAYTWYYKASYVGALISYAIVCYKALGTPQMDAGFLRRAATDENVQYFVLALFWFFSKPVGLSLIPFATFSLFHALTFLRSNVLPRAFPPTAPATAGAPPQQHPLLKSLQVWVKSNYDPAMRIVSYTELAIFVLVLLGAIIRQNSLLTPIIFAHFLRSRYYQSPFTQASIAHVQGLIEKQVRAPGRPGWLVTGWDYVKMGVGRWAGSVLVPNKPQGAGAAPAAGAARAPRA